MQNGLQPLGTEVLVVIINADIEYNAFSIFFIPVFALFSNGFATSGTIPQQSYPCLFSIHPIVTLPH